MKKYISEFLGSAFLFFAFCIAQIIGSIIAVFLYKRFFKN